MARCRPLIRVRSVGCRAPPPIQGPPGGLRLGGHDTLLREGSAKALPGAREERASSHVRRAERRRELHAGQLVDLGEEQRGALPFRDPVERPLELAREARVHRQSLGGRRGSARLAGPRDEANDLPAADLVQGNPVGDLVQPCAGPGGVLQAGVRAVRPDEGILGEVSGELRIAEHPDEIRIDLAVVAREQTFHEGARRDRVGGQHVDGIVSDGARTSGAVRLSGPFDDGRSPRGRLTGPLPSGA